MKIKENIRYVIVKDEYLTIYFKKRKGVIRIRAHDRDCGADHSEDFPWIDEDFVDIRLLTRESEKYCHVILKEPDGKGCIIELLSKQIVYDNFTFDSFKGVAKRRSDVVVSFLDKQKKTFSIRSLLEKEYVFGPYQYADIEECRYGVVLDKKTAVDNDGFVTDLSGYKCLDNGCIYHNEETDKYLLLLDKEGGLFHEPRKDENDDNILIVEFDDCICRLNIKEERIYWEKNYDDDVPMGWSQQELDEAANIAYEGHSRLELGLD